MGLTDKKQNKLLLTECILGSFIKDIMKVHTNISTYPPKNPVG